MAGSPATYTWRRRTRLLCRLRYERLPAPANAAGDRNWRQPLTQYHGAPLRVHAPTKYGYKQIKRIGLIAYTDQQPDDYWTKLGYDWYAGL